MNTISKLKNTKGNNSTKLQTEQWLLFSAYHLMLLHICSKIMKRLSLTVQSFRTDSVCILNIPKENNSELENCVCKTQVMPPCSKPVLTPCPILTHDPQHIQSILETNV